MYIVLPPCRFGKLSGVAPPPPKNIFVLLEGKQLRKVFQALAQLPSDMHHDATLNFVIFIVNYQELIISMNYITTTKTKWLACL